MPTREKDIENTTVVMPFGFLIYLTAFWSVKYNNNILIAHWHFCSFHFGFRVCTSYPIFLWNRTTLQKPKIWNFSRKGFENFIGQVLILLQRVLISRLFQTPAALKTQELNEFQWTHWHKITLSVLEKKNSVTTHIDHEISQHQNYSSLILKMRFSRALKAI